MVLFRLLGSLESYLISRKQHDTPQTCTITFDDNYRPAKEKKVPRNRIKYYDEAADEDEEDGDSAGALEAFAKRKGKKGKKLSFDDDDMDEFEEDDEDVDFEDDEDEEDGGRRRKGKKKGKGKDKKKDKQKRSRSRSRARSYDDEYADDDVLDGYDQDADDLELTNYFAKENRKNFLAAYRQIDTDGNGRVDADELAQCLRAVGSDPTPEEVTQLLKENDTDEDGTLDKEEFCELMAKYVQREMESGSKIKQDGVMEAFRKMDKSGDGVLQRKEFIEALRSNDIKISDKEGKSLFKQLDTDRNGIEIDEFEANFKSWSKEDLREFRDSWPPEAYRAFLKVLHGPMKDPTEYLLSFNGMPAGYRVSVLTNVRSRREHKIETALEPSLDPVSNLRVRDLTVAIESRSSSSGGRGKRAPKTQLLAASPSGYLQMRVDIKGAEGVPLPQVKNHRRRIMSRQVRVCMLYDPPYTLGDRFVGNIYTIPAHWDKDKEDEWSFGKRESGLAFAPQHVIVRSDFTRSMEARKWGRKNRGGRSGSRNDDDDDRHNDRRGGRSSSSAERDAEGSDGNEMDKYLNLLIELTVTVKVPRGGISSSRRKKNRKKRRGRRNDDDDDDDDDDDSDDRIMELSCGWATINMGATAMRNVGTMKLPLMAGTPFSSGRFWFGGRLCVW